MGNGADAGRQHGPQSPEQIRSVVLVGPAGVGKGTLFERLIAARVPGRHQRGEPAPSQSLGAASIASGEVMINLLDTPATRTSSARCAQVCGRPTLSCSWYRPATRSTTRPVFWRECETTNMPRAIAVTKLEQSRADFDETIARCRRVFGDVQPVGAPLIEDGHVTGAINLLRRTVTDYRSGEPTSREADEAEATIIEEHWDPLIESIIEESEDETLLDRHLSGEPIDLDIVLPDLRAAIATGRFFPIIPAHAPTGMGIEGLFELFEYGFPSPASSPLPTVLAERHSVRRGGPIRRVHWSPRLSAPRATPSQADSHWFESSPAPSAPTLRCVCGHLQKFAPHHVDAHPDHDSDDERVGPLSAPLGDEARPKPYAIAGDLVLVSKLAAAETSDTLSSKRSQRSSSPGCCPSRCSP